MGVINVTPDSFSGDGLYKDIPATLALAESMHAEGADILDIGGESTRPGYEPVSVEEELSRVIPAVRDITRRVPLPVSVDTSKAEVARQALAEGASIINDVSGLRDPLMATIVAGCAASLILVHNGSIKPGEDLIATIRNDLNRQVCVAAAAGVSPRQLLVDPGLGMGKGWKSNFEIIRRLAELLDVQKPILVGPSRKGMIGRVLGPGPEARLDGSAALVALCIAAGAHVIRVHEVRAMAKVARMMDALVRS